MMLLPRHLRILKHLNGNRMKTREFFLALAVAAAAIATSCVKEQIEDPQDKPEVEITGQVFEAIPETPASKSYLNGLTPEWIEGDEIFVYGSDDNATCTFVEGNKFQAPADVKIAGPFHAVYPAGGGNSYDAETGMFTVTVPSEQIVPAGRNVGAGALVAVASSETPELGFKNAVGLVKVNIRRNDITKVVIKTTNYETITGTCTVDLNPDKEAEGEEPAIKHVSNPGNAITLTHENGIFESGVYYATIHPRAIAGIEVTFTRKIEDAEESKTVKQGRAITIHRNSGVDLGDFFEYEISSAADLLAWNKASAKWTAWDVVTLTKDIDFNEIQTEYTWTPKQFEGFFDGNDKTIDNLVVENAGHAALFSKLQSATVQNLTFGEGCSFTSTAPVSNIVYAASLAGEIRGGCTVTGVVNKGAVTVSATSGTSGDYVGGIGGYFLADSDSRMTGCKNYGTVTYSATAAGPVYCAGVAALAATKVGLTMTGCENHGTVLFSGDNTAAMDINLGGITGIANTVTFDSCVNLGSVHSNATATNKGVSNIGGIVGVMNTACGTITNCVNGSSTDSSKGALTNDSPTSNVVRMGGFVGSVISNPINVTGFKNYGPVTNNGAVGNWNTLGGVAGFVGGISDVNTISGCENHGVVTNTKVVSRVSLGGIVGMIQNAKTNVTGNTNAGTVTNTGDAPANIGITLGGIVGRIEASTNGENTLKDNTNSGDVLFASASAYDEKMLSGVAGILGGHAGNISSSAYQPCKLTIDNCTNTGKVEKTGAGASNMFVGGIVAFLNGTAKSDTHVADVKNCTNGGAVLNGSTGAGSWTTYTGGIVGYYHVTGELKGCTNNGSVTNTTSAQIKDSFIHFRLGGIVGSADNGTITDCTNNGEVKDESETNAGCVGGIVGCATSKPITLTNCDNKKSVAVSFNSASNPYPMDLGGILGYSSENVILDGCDNSGDVTNNRTTAALNIYMGGLVGQMPNKSLTVKNCTMSGTLTNKASGGKATLGAVAGICYDNTITDTHSTMSINNAYANQYIGGFIGQVESDKTTVMSNCSIAADVVSKGAGYSGMFVGRLTDKAGTITTTLSNIWVKGSFEGTALTADNYTTYCYGTGSDYKETGNIYFGDFK